MKAGRCPGKPGEDLIWQSDLPRKLDPSQSRFSALAEPCLKIVRALRRDLIPNGEAMLAEQFHAGAVAARNTAAVDEIARLTWRAHAEGRLHDAEAEAISEAAQARRAVLAGESAQTQSKAVLGLPGGSARPRREKMFGLGRPRALDRNAKVRIMHWARCLSRRTEPGKAYGQVTAKALAVLEALLPCAARLRCGGMASAACMARVAAPRGNRNASKHGTHSADALALKRQISGLARLVRETMAAIE